MPEFTQSWAFIFIIGVICFAAGFALAIILAGSGKGSRMEEKISASHLYEIIERERKRRGKPDIEEIVK